MSRRFLPAACVLLAICATPAVADQTVEPGQTLTLKEDLVLTGADALDVKGTPDRRCTIVGNGFCVRTKGEWTGSVRIRHCDLRKLGAPPRFTDDGRRVAA